MHTRFRISVRTLVPPGPRTAMAAALRMSMALALLVAASMATAPSAGAEDAAGSAGPRSPSASTPSDPAPAGDMSKHGTIEAEIPPTRESTSGPPTRDQLNSRLTDPIWPRGTFYIGIAGHYAFELTDQIGDLSMLAPGGGASMRIGIRHDRFWATEFSGLWTSKFKEADVYYYGWGVFFGQRFYLTKSRLQPYLGAQVGFLQLQGTNFDGKEFGFSPKFSAGLDFFATETLSVGLDATYFYTVGAIKDSDFITVSLGLTWF